MDRRNRKTWLPIAQMFILLCILVWLDEILDLPHLLLGAPPTPINWREALGETALIATVGFLVVSRFMRDVTERARADQVLRAQRDLGLALSAAVGLDETLQLCLNAAIRASDLDCGGVYLVDEVSGSIDLVFHQGLPADFVTSASHYDADSDSTRLIMAGRPVYSKHQELGVPLDEARRREGLRAIAVIPVHHEGRIIACLNVASHTLDEVPAFARNALETTAGQIGSTIAHARAEKALQESEERLRAIFESAQDAIFTKDQEGHYTRVNDACASLFGLAADEMTCKTDFDLFPPDVAQRIREQDRKVLEKGEPVSVEDTKPMAGVMRTSHVVKVPLRDANGEIVGICGISRDITKRKQAEKDLQASKEYISNIIDSSLDMIIACDMKRHIVEFNTAAQETFGYRREEVIGEHVDILYNGIIGVLQVVDTQVDRFQPTDLRLAESLATTAAIAIENARLYEQARQDAETKSVLLDEINHRVKNNLSAIIGLLYTERRYADMDSQATYQSVIQNLVNRVRGLATVHSLLSASGWA
ncbi:MAG: PAS domain S-box protein, partial [Anaerolineae bacterium]|nr:PAS domain S-box protein [Anaerolineae bacterium]